MEGEEPLPDDLRCKRTDGRDWRCKRRVVDGKSFCEAHLYRGQKKRPSSPNPNPNSNSNSDSKPTPRLRIRVRVKPEPVDDAPAPVSVPSSVPVPDHLRCHRNDGRSWRCKRQVVEGQMFCEMHCPQKRPRMLEERENGTGSPSPVPENRRCARNNGKDWRCKREALEGHSFCEIHLNRTKNKDKVKEKRIATPLLENEEPSPFPESLRCTRNDGRDWRCKRRVVDGQNLCEAHFKKLKIKGPCSEDVEKEREKSGPSPKKRRRVFPPVPENLRCTLIDGRGRCQRRSIEGGTLCEVHWKRAEKCQINKKLNVATIKPEPDTEPELEPVSVKEKEKDKQEEKEKEEEEKEKEKVKEKKKEKGKEKKEEKGKEKEKEKENERGTPLVEGEGDDLRCKRTDGRGWRCKMKVLEGKTLCEIHYEQGRLRQMKVTVPESMKIKRGEGGEEKIEKKLKKKRELEVLENTSDKGMKRMKADLIRVFLRREIIERSKKGEKGCESSGEVTRDLPYGLMAIPPAPSTQFLDNAESLGVKVGVQCYKPTVNRRFRSKNIEPPPISSSKVVPYVGNLGKVKNNGRRKCHWCRRTENKTLAKCLSCRKRFFCSDCMKERCSDPQEVKRRCPVCRGSCDCKFCRTTKSKNMGPKEIVKEQYTGSKLQQLQYLINFLLPILVQINQVQGVEMEKEAKFKGQNLSEVEIRQADVGCSDSCCCNNCKSPILDFHRSCPNCSYNLCLSCCREYSQGGSLRGHGNVNIRTKTHRPGLKSCSEKTQNCSSAPSTENADLASSASLAISATCHQISCPPLELGGCDNSILDLRCIFPLNWTKELEISATEMVSECDFLQTRDDSVQCSLCASLSEADKSKELLEASRRKDSEDNFLYCPCASDDHDVVLAHFQRHWQKGHPVKVHKLLRDGSNLSWDPLNMFSCYLEKAIGNCENVKEVENANHSDWYDVEIGIKESFTRSLGKGCTRKRRETLKLKANLSSALSRKLFESHYAGIICALPLQEYTNPRTGLLNLAGKLPEDFPASKIGPHLCISCGSREEIARGELVTNLCYNSYDVVNVLVHADGSHCSTELLSKIKKLMKHSGSNNQEGHCLQSSESEGTRMHSEILLGAGGQDRVLERNSLSQGVTGSCSVAANDPSGANIGDDKSPAKVHGSDTDSDASMVCSGARHSPEKSIDQMSHLDRMEGTSLSDIRHPSNPCGAEWDVFRRQDIPKLLEYIAKHMDEFNYSCDLQKNVVHPIFDGSFYLDATHKLRLKEEFDIEPWTFNQCLGEAVFIPAGCPYQIKNIKSCVSVVVGFVSPESASECIKLMGEIRVLPNDHKANQEKLEVEKMTICSVDEAIKEIYRLKNEVRNHPSLP